MKILLDMNLTPRWVGFLRERGYRAVRWSEVGLASANDLEVLRFVAREGYLLLTHDLDFGDLLAYSREARPSVVICGEWICGPRPAESTCCESWRQRWRCSRPELLW